MSIAELKELRREVKKIIDHADERFVRKVYDDAIAEADKNADWWDNMPENIRADIAESLAQADKGEVMTHKQVKKKYPQWFTK